MQLFTYGFIAGCVVASCVWAMLVAHYLDRLERLTVEAEQRRLDFLTESLREKAIAYQAGLARGRALYAPEEETHIGSQL